MSSLEDEFINTMLILDEVYITLTTKVPYDALVSEESRLIMAQEMAKIRVLLTLYGPPGEEGEPQKTGFIDGIRKFKF